MIKINILDQSPVISGYSQTDAVNQTIDLAKFGDENSYHRYWVAEHHNTKSFASASPEILISAIASSTKNIRAGSGGVLISHYSPFKIAEQFNMLQSLYPGRIDLGIGRAPGGDSKILKAFRTQNEDAFEKTNELIHILKNNSENKVYNNLTAVPSGSGIPEIWILGTSPDSALFAARNGLRYAFGSFINDEFMLQCFQMYYQNFQPSVFLKKPYLNVAVFAVCAESESEAHRLSRCSEYWLVKTFLKSENIEFPDEETSMNYNFTPEEKMVIEYRRRSAFIGDADTVTDRMKDFVKKYAVQELTIVTIVSDHEKRKNSYCLIAERMKDVCLAD